MRKHIGSTVLFLLGAWCVSALPGRPQTPRWLTVKVVDRSGGGVGAATVTLLSDDRVFTDTTNNYGEAIFEPPPLALRYVEVSARGFSLNSVAIPNQDAREISVPIDVGSCSGGCGWFDSRDHSVHYEERGSRAQLVGSVSEYSGPLLPNTELRLMKADTDVTASRQEGPNRQLPMKQRRWQSYQLVSKIVSDSRGEFQFAGLEPGWYRLEAVRDGYANESAEFWIARNELTKPAPLEMINKAAGLSPMKRVQEAAPLERTPE